MAPSRGRPQDLLAVGTAVHAATSGGPDLHWDVGTNSRPREFDTATGAYTVSADGYFLLRARVEAPAEARREQAFVALAVIYPDGAEHIEHVHGDAGLLLHLRTGSAVSVRLLRCAPDGDASAAPACGAASTPRGLAAAGPVGMRVHLSVELAMRKRKRAADLEEDEEEERLASAQRRRAARQRSAAGLGGHADADDGSSHTGSDTEWSDGFSSDNEERRAARPPRRVRRVARQLAVASVDGDSRYILTR